MQISCSSEKSFQWYFLKYWSSLTMEIEESLSVVIFKSWSECFWELMQFLADCVFLACEAEQVQGTPFSADVSCWWGTAKEQDISGKAGDPSAMQCGQTYFPSSSEDLQLLLLSLSGPSGVQSAASFSFAVCWPTAPRDSLAALGLLP